MVIRKTIVNLVEKRLPEAYGADPLRDIQIITPRREKNVLSCREINIVLQQRLNPNPVVNGCDFRIGDKVIQTRNNYNFDIVNGDIGYVRAIDTKDGTIKVNFENPDRIVILPLYENHLDLAYSITIHKAQGSEARFVIIPIHKSAGHLIMQRNLLYTAVSRARELCILVGQRNEIPKIIQRKDQQQRYTNLEAMLSDV